MRKKSTKLPSKPYYTVAVRFLDAASVHRIFTYRVRRGKTVHLGQGLIADTSRGPAIVVVVRIDATSTLSVRPHHYEKENEYNACVTRKSS
jgi:hypothetical protein